MHIFKCFENHSDTYYDTQTHYLMEQDPFTLQDETDVMDVVAADKVEALKGRKHWPSRAMLNLIWILVLHV